jgi:hypothetical protein
MEAVARKLLAVAESAASKAIPEVSIQAITVCKWRQARKDASPRGGPPRLGVARLGV